METPNLLYSTNPGTKALTNLAVLQGTNCRVTLRNGERFEGVFSGASVEPSDARFTMKMVKRVSAAMQSNGAAEKLNEYIGNGEDYMVAFDLQDTIDLNVWDVQLSAAENKAQNGKRKGRVLSSIIADLT